MTTGCILPSVATVFSQDPVPEHQSFKLESKEVNEVRTICVWTPKDYKTSSRKYPVLYMPDGGIKEDFPHIANTIAKLIDQKNIPEFILVGIENTERRRDLTGPSSVKSDQKIAPTTDGASRFRAFISNELIPEIERRFRTSKNRGIIGESAAGLFVVETLLLKPKMFDFYIAMDPAIYWNDSYLVRTAKDHLKKFPRDNKRFWFAGSNATDISSNTRRLAEILKTSAPKSLVWTYSDQPKEKHSTIFRATKEAALKWATNPPNE